MNSILNELPIGFIAVFVGLLGAAIGSFLNVVIYRVPRDESLFNPGSHCPQCHTLIHPWHNIPVISYLLLSGHCAYCGEKISLRYPIVEALTAIVSIWAFLLFGWSWATLGGMVLSWHLIALAFIDWDTMTLPDHLVLPMGIAGFVFALLSGGLLGLFSGIISAAIGAKLSPDSTEKMVMVEINEEEKQISISEYKQLQSERLLQKIKEEEPPGLDIQESKNEKQYETKIPDKAGGDTDSLQS